MFYQMFHRSFGSSVKVIMKLIIHLTYPPIYSLFGSTFHNKQTKDNNWRHYPSDVIYSTLQTGLCKSNVKSKLINYLLTMNCQWLKDYNAYNSETHERWKGALFRACTLFPRTCKMHWTLTLRERPKSALSWPPYLDAFCMLFLFVFCVVLS